MEKRIQADMVAAMKAKDSVKLASLRAIKAAIMLTKTAEGATGEVTDQDVVKIDCVPECGQVLAYFSW